MPCFHYTTWKGSRGFRFVTAGRKRERLSCMAAGIKLCIKSTLMPRISRSVQQRTILWGSDLDFRLYLAIQASLCRHLLHLCGTCVCECVIHCRTGCGISYLCARGLMIKSLCVFLKWRSSSSSDVRRAHSLDVMSKSNNLLFFKMHTKNRGEKQKKPATTRWSGKCSVRNTRWHLGVSMTDFDASLKLCPEMIFTDLLSFLASELLNDSWHHWLIHCS